MYIDVILPLKLAWCPTYSCEWDAAPGDMIVVELVGHEYVGVVRHTGITPGLDAGKVLPAKGPAPDLPRIESRELRFWEFLADYYLCTIGEIFKLAYPASRIHREQVAVRAEARAEKKRLKELEKAARKRKGTAAPEYGRTDRAAGEAKRFVAGKPLVIVGRNRQPEYDKYIREAGECGKQVLVLSSGSRSSLFSRFTDLGLIIVDEEQDSYYKPEQAPHVNFRDAAVALAGIYGAQVILGTSLPSLETELNCLTGKYLKRTLEDCVPGPDVRVIDIAAERRKNGMSGLFSRKLISILNSVRGKVTFVRGWEDRSELDRQISELFPGRETAVCSLSEVLQHSDAGQAATVLLQADAFVSREDFRADEKALQLISRLAPAAPLTIIQTSVPDRFENSRDSSALLAERKEFNYPPYTRMVDIVFEDKNTSRMRLNSEWLMKILPEDINASPIRISPSQMRIRTTLKRDRRLAERKAEIEKAVRRLEAERSYTGHIVMDVDPF